jgi:hypothetical protein
MAQQDFARRAVSLGLHRGDRVAEHREVHFVCLIDAGSQRSETGEVPACGETDDPDAFGAFPAEPLDLAPQREQGLRVANHQRVVVDAGGETEPAQPLHDRLGLVLDVLGITAAGQHDHVCR